MLGFNLVFCPIIQYYCFNNKIIVINHNINIKIYNINHSKSKKY